MPSCREMENAPSLTFVSQTLQEGDVVQAKNLADLGLFSQQLQVLSGVEEQQIPPSERCRCKELKSGLFFSSDSKQVLRIKASYHKSLHPGSKQAQPRAGDGDASAKNRTICKFPEPPHKAKELT